MSAISKRTHIFITSTKIAISGVVIGLILVSIQCATAIPDLSPADLYKQSDMVFYGQVISKQPGPGPDYDYYQVKVKTYFKNPQTSDSVTVAGHKNDNMTHMSYPQFEAGDKAIFYITNEQGINVISPYSTQAGEGCDIHAFLGPNPIQGEPIIRGPPSPLEPVTDVNMTTRGPFTANQSVLVSYDVWNNFPQSRDFIVELSATNQNDTSDSFYKKQNVQVGACDAGTVRWSFAPTKSGIYFVNATENGKFRAGTSFDVIDSNLPVSEKNIISSNETQFQLKINQTISQESGRLKITLLNVTSDSRCPTGVTCIWQGQVAVSGAIQDNQSLGSFSLSSTKGQDYATFGGYTLHLVQVNPYPSVNKILPSDYTVLFTISNQVLSPLTQFNLGTMPIDVKCGKDFVLLLKAEDETPACVKPGTVKVLTERGWAEIKSYQTNHNSNVKANPFGVAGLMIYYGGGPCGVGTCPLNTFNLKINSNYTAYLLGYNICDGTSCTKSDDLKVLLPLNRFIGPYFKTIALPEGLPWKHDDTFHIQVMVSPTPDNKTAMWTDLGNSTIVP